VLQFVCDVVKDTGPFIHIGLHWNCYYSPPDRGAKYCDERVCLCVCLSVIISSELHIRSSSFFVHVTYGRGSVLLWRRSDMHTYIYIQIYIEPKIVRTNLRR